MVLGFVEELEHFGAHLPLKIVGAALSSAHQEVERQQADRFNVSAPGARVVWRIYDFLELEANLFTDLWRLKAGLDRGLRHHTRHVGEANVRDKDIIKVLLIDKDIIGVQVGHSYPISVQLDAHLKQLFQNTRDLALIEHSFKLGEGFVRVFETG